MGTVELTVAQGVAVVALWRAGFNSFDIARLLHLAEADVYAVLNKVRETARAA
jgi:hypothetical protein